MENWGDIMPTPYLLEMGRSEVYPMRCSRVCSMWVDHDLARRGQIRILPDTDKLGSYLT